MLVLVPNVQNYHTLSQEKHYINSLPSLASVKSHVRQLLWRFEKVLMATSFPGLFPFFKFEGKSPENEVVLMGLIVKYQVAKWSSIFIVKRQRRTKSV